MYINAKPYLDKAHELDPNDLESKQGEDRLLRQLGLGEGGVSRGNSGTGEKHPGQVNPELKNAKPMPLPSLE